MSGGRPSSSHRYLCFTEVKVSEYIVGSGPPVLTVTLHKETLHKYTDEDRNVSWRKRNHHDLKGSDYNEIVEVSEPYNPQSVVADTYEGKEMVLFLGIPITSKVEAWTIRLGRLSFWFIQKQGNNVRAVSAYYDRAASPENRSKLNLPLSELRAKIKQADTERDRITGGRLIVTPDADTATAGGTDPTPLMIVTDANKLKELYQAAGAVYQGENKTVLPPPAGYVPPPTTSTSTLKTQNTTTTSP